MLLKVALLINAIALINTQVVDNTLTPEAKGSDVVDVVVNKIQRSEIFADDREFLRRIAYVESLFGEHKNTFRSGYNGGIWQVDRIGFESTQVNRAEGTTAKLKQIHAAIEEKFGIDWMKVTWEDLRKPFYSGLAARIFLSDKTEKIPDDCLGQAKYWKKYYNTAAGGGSVEHFVKLVEDLEGADAKLSGGQIDLTVVIDGSGSIGISAFDSAKTAISNMVRTFNQREANIGVVVYASYVARRVPFNSTSSMDELVDIIRGLGYPESGTNTYAGMMAAVSMYDGLDKRRTEGIPRVMLVFTDGQHNEGPPPWQAAMEAALAGITTMGFGIGSGINDEELLQIAKGEEKNVIRTQDYETLKEQIARIARRAKEVPKTPQIGKVQKEKFSEPGEKRFYRLPVPPAGVTVDLAASEGAVRGFYSYTVEQPSSALYDGVVEPGKTFIPAPAIRRRRQVEEDTAATEVPPTTTSVYLTLESQAANTTVTMDTGVGDTTGAASTITVSTGALLLMLATTILFHR